MLTFDGLLDGLTEQATGILAEHHGDQTNAWRENPAPFREFVERRDHLGLPPFYPLQYAAVEALLGGDPRRIFEEPQPFHREPLDWIPITSSSNVVAIAAAPAEQALYIEYQRNRAQRRTGQDAIIYRYDGAHPELLDQLLQAPSVGKYLAEHVKPHHAATRIDLDGSSPEEITHLVGPGAARAYQAAVLLWGKGAGKDYICSVVVAYLVHVLLCLRNPGAYLGLAPGEAIDIVNVAYNADQAKRVFFAKFKQRLERWRWLRENFDVFEAGRRKWKETGGAGRPRVDINDNEVVFPNLIRCVSRHAQNESYEGLNVIAWIMDEASAFLTKTKEENAGKIHKTLESSATSRFQKRWVGFIISYSRHADDFTCKQLRDAKARPELGYYADGPRATWEVNEGTARQERVEVRPGHYVPVEFANHYLKDFDDSRARYECMPPAAVDALIKEPQRLWDAVQRGRAPLIEWEATVTRREVAGGEVREYAAVRILKMRPLPTGARLYVHGDPARSSDGFGLGFAHGVPATVMTYVPAAEVMTARKIRALGLEPEAMVPWERDVTRTVIDALLIWRPNPRLNRHVDLINVQDVLWEILKHYGRSRFGGTRDVAGITFDQYDSAETIQRLNAGRYYAENEAWSNPFQHRIFRGTRSAFYNDLVTLPDTPSITSDDPSEPGAIYELTRVQEIDGHKIDHPEGGSKDLADVVARLVEHCTGTPQRKISFAAADHRHAAQQPPGPSGPKVNPKSPKSPVSDAMRDLDAARAQSRPEGEWTAADPPPGSPEPQTSGGRMSFASVNYQGRR